MSPAISFSAIEILPSLLNKTKTQTIRLLDFNRIEEHEIMWFIGFFEGEGSFTYKASGNPRRRFPSMQVAQNEREILERLKLLFGGKVYELKGNTSIGRSSCFRWSSHKKSEQLSWREIFKKYPMKTLKKQKQIKTWLTRATYRQ